MVDSSKAPRFDVTSVKVTRKGTALRLFLLAIPAFCVAAGLNPNPYAELVLQLGIGLLFSSGAFLLVSRSSPAALLVEGDTLVLERGRKRRRIPLDRIALGLILPTRNPAAAPRSRADPLLYEVEFELKNGNVVRVQAESMAEATAILEAARLDPSQRRLSLRLRRVMNQLIAGLFVAPLVFLGGTAALCFMLILLLPWVAKVNIAFASMAAVGVGILVLWRAFMSAEVTIGSDGIVVRTRYKKRFIAYPRLKDIVEHGSDIELRYRDGTSEVIPGDIDDPARRTALVSRMQDAMQSGASAHARVFALGRNGRPIAAWRESLHRLLDGDAGYRSANLTRDDALAIVKDAGARTEHRVAAALALSASTDPTIQQRVRIAAQACAAERVRIALEQAAEGDIEEEILDEALREEQVR